MVRKNKINSPRWNEKQKKAQREYELQHSIAYLSDFLEAPFLKSAALKLLEEKFGWTHDEAKQMFDGLVASETVATVAGTRRYEVKRSPAGWVSGTVFRSRSGVTMFETDDYAGAAKDRRQISLGDNGADILLSGDTVWAKMTYDGTYAFLGLRRRKTDKVVCRLCGASKKKTPGNSYGYDAGPGAMYARVDIGEVNRSELENKVFVVKLSDESMQPFFMGAHLTGEVVEVLGNVDDSDVEIDVALRRFNLPYEFSQPALAQAESLPDEVDENEVKLRVDLRDIGFVTIDGEDARDFDDAVWCTPTDSGWRLLVAIADVSHYVTEASPLDKDAQTRLTSVYFPRRVIPMLPEKLSNGLCSLNPNVDRCTFVCDMMIDQTGHVTAYQFYPALIHSKARLTYTCVWDALNGKDEDLTARGGVLSDISNLYTLYKALRQARAERGAIDFETSETEIVSDPQTKKIVAIKKREHNDAHRLIEECMLAANVCAAQFIGMNRAQSLYRVHGKPTLERLTALRETLSGFDLTLGGGAKPQAKDFEKIIEEVKNKPYADVIQNAMLRSMQQAVYSPKNEGHYGLNYEAYTHFTSPIRRYPDLLVHRTIRAILAGKKYEPQVVGDVSDLMQSRAAQSIREKAAASAAEGGKKPAEDKIDPAWKTLGLLSSAAERRADEASRDVVQWLKCQYINQYVGKSFKGVITGVVPAGIFVTLKNLFVEGFVHVSRLGEDYYEFNERNMCFYGEWSGERFRIGDTVCVRVMSVSMQDRSIEFTINDYEPDYFSFKRSSRGSNHRRR